MKKSVIWFMIFILCFSQPCLADVSACFHETSVSESFAVADFAIEGQFIHDVCQIDDTVYVLATPYEALAESGPFTLYRIDEGVPQQIGNENAIGAFAADERGVLYVSETVGNKNILYLNREGELSVYSDMPKTITAMVCKNGIILASSGDCIWAVSRGTSRTLESFVGKTITELRLSDEKIVCRCNDGSYAEITFEADLEEDFLLDVPEQWKDARLTATIEAFETMYPEYKVVFCEEPEDADVRIVDAAEFDGSAYGTMGGVINFYFEENTGTDLLFQTLLPLNSLFIDEIDFEEEDWGSEGILEDYFLQPVDVGIWMLEQQMELPEECKPLPENCTYQELYAWAETVKEETGIAGFADDSDLPIAIRAYFSSFGIYDWNEEEIYQSEEFVQLLEMAKNGFVNGSVISGEGEAFYAMKLVDDYTDLKNARLLPQLQSGCVYPAECSVIGRGFATEDELRNDARSNFLYLYLNMQDRIGWNEKGAGILKDVEEYLGDCTQISEEERALWASAFSSAKVPNWKRYASETIPYEQYILDIIKEYLNTEMTPASAVRRLSQYMEAISEGKTASVR